VKKNTKLSKYEWIIFAGSYLKIAQIALDEMEYKNYMKSGFDKLFFYEGKQLLISIIWNFKHAKIVASGTLLDAQNDLFRYPDNTASFTLNLQMFRDIVSRETDELHDDIEKLKSLLGILDNQITQAKSKK